MTNVATINNVVDLQISNGLFVPNLQSAYDFYQSGDFIRAERILGALLFHDPHEAHAYHLLGLCKMQQGDLTTAESAMRSAVEIIENPSFYFDLGRILRAAGKLDDAVATYEASLRLYPGSAIVWNNLANIRSDQGQIDKAIDAYRRAIHCDPDYALAHKNLGVALFSAGRLQEAEITLRKAIDIKEDFFDAQKPLAYLLASAGRTDEAMKAYKWWGLLQFEMRKEIVWADLAVAESMYLRACEAGLADPVPPFRILFTPGVTPEIERNAGRAFALAEIPELQQPAICQRQLAISDAEPIRVGYLSSDFYNHATMHLIAGILEAHDPSKFQVEIFAYGQAPQDEFSRRLIQTKLPITNISDLTNEQAAKIICERQIDLLVDLKGYTGSARMGITALRPAPVIINWLGYPGTMGHEQLADYIIGDRIVTLPENAEHFSERLAFMPHSYQPNDRRRPLPDTPSRELVGLPDDALVFCSFNQPVKFNPQTFDIWSRLLVRVADSVLWLLKPESDAVRINILKEFKLRSIPAERIIFAPFASQADHMARLRNADIALDTYPCNSHTTASDALWAGVPLVTMIGGIFASRVAASLLTTHGFPELIANDAEDYYRLALELATDAQRRADLRTRLDSVRISSPLFNTEQFTRDLERLYREIADNHSLPEEQRAPFVGLNRSRVPAGADSGTRRPLKPAPTGQPHSSGDAADLSHGVQGY